MIYTFVIICLTL
jgi:hypothetical protein